MSADRDDQDLRVLGEVGLEKTNTKKKYYQEWEDAPVTLEDIDEAGIADLLKNDTDKLRLINVWATWCGPCVLEYPDFIEMQRMLR